MLQLRLLRLLQREMAHPPELLEQLCYREYVLCGLGWLTSCRQHWGQGVAAAQALHLLQRDNNRQRDVRVAAAQF